MLDFVASLVSSLAWPLTFILVLWWFQEPVKKLISRLKTFKHGDYEYSFADDMKVAAALGGPWAKEFEREEPVLVEKYRRRMKLSIEEDGSNANGSYRKLRNGLLICNIRYTIAPGVTTAHITVPASYNHQITSVQFVGDVSARVLELSTVGLSLSFESQPLERVIEIVTSGV